VLKEGGFLEDQTAVLYSDICLKHYVPKWHLERPRRLEAIMEGLRPIRDQFPKSLRILEDFEPLESSKLLIAHSSEYIEKIQVKSHIVI
jgi:acetoin utilization deacetylase AcuC-like enzyme